MGDGLFECTLSLRWRLLEGAPFPSEEVDADQKESVANREITCAIFGILDACSVFAFDSRNRELTKDEEKAVMHALIRILKEELGFSEDAAVKAIHDLFDDLESEKFAHIRQEWGQKAHADLMSNEFRVAELKALAHTIRSGRKINPTEINNPFFVMNDAINDDLDRFRASMGVRPASKGCFIATACYGDFNAPEVLILREFRDKQLQCSKIGSMLISIYYAFSPRLARFLSRHGQLSRVVRIWMLDPIVRIIGKASGHTTWPL